MFSQPEKADVMQWTFEEIKSDWLAAGVPMEPERLVAAFERVETMLGRSWIDNARLSNEGGAVVKGIAPTMRVADMGQKLRALERVRGNVDKLLRRIREGDLSAEAELATIYLLRSRTPDALVEVYPHVDGREPDLRTRLGQHDWTYIEIAQPNKSQAEKAAHRILVQLTQSLQEAATGFSVDVYLRREPVHDEVITIIEKIRALSRQEGTKQLELPDNLGVLLLNLSAPGEVARLQLPGEGPRIALVAIAGDGNKPNRKISVSIPFSDARAADFLTSEAAQLPTGYPGLIALEVSRASGGIKAWAPVLERCFQPDLYSRVSAVCLFDDAILTFHNSELPVFDTRLVHNPHAKFPLPEWIAAAVLESRKEFDQAMSSQSSTGRE